MMWGYTDGSAWLWMMPMMLLSGDSAMATLRQRLAAGQISQEEFDKTKRILQG